MRRAAPTSEVDPAALAPTAFGRTWALVASPGSHEGTATAAAGTFCPSQYMATTGLSATSLSWPTARARAASNLLTGFSCRVTLPVLSPTSFHAASSPSLRVAFMTSDFHIADLAGSGMF